MVTITHDLFQIMGVNFQYETESRIENRNAINSTTCVQIVKSKVGQSCLIRKFVNLDSDGVNKAWSHVQILWNNGSFSW